MSKIMYVVNDAWFFLSHRLPLAEKALEEGMTVVLVAQADKSVADITKHGISFRNWDISPRGKSLLDEVNAFWQLCTVIQEERPDIVHLVTIKPVLYGGLLCRLLSVPAVVYAVSGLGAVFEARTFTSKFLKFLITPLYKIAVNHTNACMIFQNTENRDSLLKHLKLPRLNTIVVRGSGVRLENFRTTKPPTEPVVFTLAARLLKDKGISEFVKAACMLEEEGLVARYIVSGDMAGAGNPSAYSSEEIRNLASTSPVDFVGHTNDMPELFARSSVVVLPSYHEGLPKVLVEAGASSRAVITTDIPGCRDAILPGVSGLLVPAENSKSLAESMKLLALNHVLLTEMGVAGRRLVEREMRVEIISNIHFDIYRELLEQRV